MAPSDPARHPDSPSAPVRGTTGFVLVVEDDPRLRLLVAEFLRGEGFAVDVAGSGAEALVQIEWERPELMLLDIHLPDMNGAELVDELHARGVDVPVIVMTAAHDAQQWALLRSNARAHPTDRSQGAPQAAPPEPLEAAEELHRDLRYA